MTDQLLRESERINILLEDVERTLSSPGEGKQLSSFGDQLTSRFDAIYRRFEDLYRGSRAEIILRIGAYHELLRFVQTPRGWTCCGSWSRSRRVGGVPHRSRL